MSMHTHTHAQTHTHTHMRMHTHTPADLASTRQADVFRTRDSCGLEEDKTRPLHIKLELLLDLLFRYGSGLGWVYGWE